MDQRSKVPQSCFNKSNKRMYHAKRIGQSSFSHSCKASSATVSVLVNGSPTKEFSMQRGLRQGKNSFSDNASSFVSPDNASAMLHQLSSLQIPRKARSCWKLTISATVWAIWFNRNNIVFGKQYWDENRLIDLVQTKTFSWIKGNSTSAKFSFVDWCQFPTYCTVDF
ncbi:hypothetical protein SLA2020_049870 [Shorea laevis]